MMLTVTRPPYRQRRVLRVDDDELPVLGTEPLVVEFANTRYGDEDFLGTPERANRWFTATGTRPARDLAAARALRDSIHALFTAAVTAAAPPAAAIAHVNATAARAPTHPHLTRQPTGALAAERRGAATGDAALLGGLATACADLLTDDRARLLRRCAGPDCCLFFVQQHPRRRYCHESCAHRDRQARYYRRRSTPN
jgi:predicted RNA-binding Zn ribbon-like protein